MSFNKIHIVKWGYYDPLQDMFTDIYTYNVNFDNDYMEEIKQIKKNLKKIKNEEKLKLKFIIYKLEILKGVQHLHGRSGDYKKFLKCLKSEIDDNEIIFNFENLKF
jgi:hypothetical protein